ncbi:MAG: 4Fe-4S ferredoxin [Desulfobacteraceae bacterium 4484_190.1]|nr:MAG: 4Fe-4S ferredoxin [Desulfobacteraceae bacterium 4484_190.1]
MKVKRKIIEIDEELCDGCGNCVTSCAEGALQIINGKARVVKDQFCDGLGACIGECPQGALKIVERVAEDFDEKAVEEYLKELEQKEKGEENRTENLPCGCPSAEIKTFTKANSSCESANIPSEIKESALGHWPVQIRLIPVNASFLKDADILVTADCVPVAYPSFHSDFIKNRIVMLGCPKFDDTDSYVEKLTEIFRTADIKSVTVLIMEVPCCSGLPGILKRAMDMAKVNIPMKQIVISSSGKIV